MYDWLVCPSLVVFSFLFVVIYRFFSRGIKLAISLPENIKNSQEIEDALKAKGGNVIFERNNNFSKHIDDLKKCQPDDWIV